MKPKALIVILFFCALRLPAGDRGYFVNGISSKILTMNPFTGTGSDLWTAQNLIYDFLLREKPDAKGEFIPALAVRWSLSKDKKTYEFEIRGNAYWHDGQPVRAEDVKFSLEHLFDEKYKSVWRGSFEGIEKVEVLGPLKVRIVTKEPRYELWASVARRLKILPRHHYAEPGIRNDNKNAIGSGPYKLAEFSTGTKLRLTKNPSWWGWREKSYPHWYPQDQIEFRTILERGTVATYLKKGEIDVYPFEEMPTGKKINPSPRFIADPNHADKTVELIEFNLKNALFADLQVRKALNQLIDRESLCTKLYDGGRPADRLWNDGSSLANPGLRSAKKQALRALKDAGWVDGNKDGILDKKSKPFEFETVYTSAESEAILTMIAQQLKSGGIHLKLKKMDESIAWTVMHEKNYTAILSRISDQSAVQRSVWHSSGFYNNSGFSDDAVDALLVRLDREFDSKKRKKIERRLHEKIERAVPSLLLCDIDFPDYWIGQHTEAVHLKSGIPFWGWFEKVGQRRNVSEP